MENTDEENRSLWVPEQEQWQLSGDSLAEVVKSYSLFLEVCHPKLFKLFQERLKSDPDAARAEAVVFSWLRSEQYDPSVSESPQTGGIDFFCTPASQKPFLLEVTHLDREAVEKRSGWPDQLDDVVRAFSQITPHLWSKSKGKAPQLAGHDSARLLAICLSHVGAAALLGTLAAEWFMTSQPKIAVPIALDGRLKDSWLVTDLKKAAFMAVRDGQIVPVRQSISAILLVAIWEDQLNVLLESGVKTEILKR